MWPTDRDALEAVQRGLAAETPASWVPTQGSALRVVACWVCFPRGITGRGARGDPAWLAAVTTDVGVPRGSASATPTTSTTISTAIRTVEERVLAGRADASYTPGLLALRVGRLMEETVRLLSTPPDVLLVDATGRDHPRGAGLALQLGAVLDLPTVGVTHRPLLAEGTWPADIRGASSPLRIGDHVVASWLRTRPGTRPLVVHPGWRVDLGTAVAVVASVTARRRTPEPLRRARHRARVARSAADTA